MVLEDTDNGGGGGGGGLIYVFLPVTLGVTIAINSWLWWFGMVVGSQTQVIMVQVDDSSFGGLTVKGGGFGRGGINTLSGGPGGSGGGGTGHGSGGGNGSCMVGRSLQYNQHRPWSIRCLWFWK